MDHSPSGMSTMTSMDADEFPDDTDAPLTTQATNPTPAWKFGANENGEFPEGPDDNRDLSSAFEVIPAGADATSEAAATVSGDAGLLCDS